MNRQNNNSNITEDIESKNNLSIEYTTTISTVNIKSNASFDMSEGKNISESKSYPHIETASYTPKYTANILQTTTQSPKALEIHTKSIVHTSTTQSPIKMSTYKYKTNTIVQRTTIEASTTSIPFWRAAGISTTKPTKEPIIPTNKNTKKTTPTNRRYNTTDVPTKQTNTTIESNAEANSKAAASNALKEKKKKAAEEITNRIGNIDFNSDDF